MSPLRILEYYSALKRREALTLATTWMDPESMVLSERSRHRRTRRVRFHWWETFRTGRSTDTETGFLVVRGRGEGDLMGLPLGCWNVLELDYNECFTNLWVYQEPLNCTAWMSEFYDTKIYVFLNILLLPQNNSKVNLFLIFMIRAYFRMF